MLGYPCGETQQEVVDRDIVRQPAMRGSSSESGGTEVRIIRRELDRDGLSQAKWSHVSVSLRIHTSMSPMIDLRIRCFSFALLLGSFVSANAAEPFLLCVPRLPDKQIVPLLVESSGDDTMVRRGTPLDLPEGGGRIAYNAPRRQLLVTQSGKTPSTATTIQIRRDGGLQLVGSSHLERPSGYTSVDRSGEFFLTVSYGSGDVAVYRIKKDGVVGAMSDSLVVPRKEAHCLWSTPDNRFAYVPCVKNNNALYQFSFDSETGTLAPLDPFDARPPAMFGPRHVAYHPSLPLAYFSNEQQLGVSVYQIADSGQLTGIQHAQTMPRRSPYVQGKRGMHASDVVIAPDGKLLFVAVRDFIESEDSVFVFRVGEDGKLGLASRSKVGDIPWKLAVSPDGRYLAVSESGDQKLSIWGVREGGALQKIVRLDWGSAVRDMVAVSIE